MKTFHLSKILFVKPYSQVTRPLRHFTLTFFGGNKNSRNVRRVTEVAAGGLATFLAREAREKAVKDAERKGVVRTKRAIRQASEPTTSQEAYTLERKAVREARSEDPILYTEDTIKEKASGLTSWLFES